MSGDCETQVEPTTRVITLKFTKMCAAIIQVTGLSKNDSAGVLPCHRPWVRNTVKPIAVTIVGNANGTVSSARNTRAPGLRRR
jgi:hypothetical protein